MGEDSQITRIFKWKFLKCNQLREFFSEFFIYDLLPLCFYEIAYNKVLIIRPSQSGALFSLLVSYLVVFLYTVELLIQIYCADKFIPVIHMEKPKLSKIGFIENSKIKIPRNKLKPDFDLRGSFESDDNDLPKTFLENETKNRFKLEMGLKSCIKQQPDFSTKDIINTVQRKNLDMLKPLEEVSNFDKKFFLSSISEIESSNLNIATVPKY